MYVCGVLELVGHVQQTFGYAKRVKRDEMKRLAMFLQPCVNAHSVFLAMLLSK